MHSKRNLLALLALAGLGITAHAQPAAADWPNKPIWRVVGEYANYSIFDVASNDELHQLLQGLPLFPFMKISVTPLAQHPSAI